MKYDVIIFDADETLFDFKKAEQVAFNNLFNEFKINNDDKTYKVYHEINNTIWKEFEQGFITQEALKVERFNRFIKRLNLNLNPEVLANSYMQHLANASILYPESSDLIKRLAQNYRLVIITNGLKDVQEKRISQSTIAPYFEAIVISEVVKVAKPDSRIFEYALKTINYNNKRKVLMVGDSLTSDIQGGINYQIDTCWYNPHQIKNTTNITPTYEVTSLNDLEKIL